MYIPYLYFIPRYTSAFADYLSFILLYLQILSTDNEKEAVIVYAFTASFSLIFLFSFVFCHHFTYFLLYIFVFLVIIFSTLCVYSQNKSISCHIVTECFLLTRWHTLCEFYSSHYIFIIDPVDRFWLSQCPPNLHIWDFSHCSRKSKKTPWSESLQTLGVNLYVWTQFMFSHAFICHRAKVIIQF